MVKWGTAVVGALVVLVSLAWFGAGRRGGGGHDRAPSQAFSIESRPQGHRRLFDYAGNLTHFEESVQRFLGRMDEQRQIEAVIVTLRSLPENTHLEELAVDLVDHWRIGGEHGGRGLLLLLIEQDRQVKLEVTYELEDVFTDAFAAHVQDLQLRPYYLTDDIGTGLIAVMEELEQRAELKQRGDYTPREVATLDEQLLTGGGGARRHLERYESDVESAVAVTAGPRKGAASPQEAWNVMLAKWAGRGGDIDVDVYTEITKLEMGDPDEKDSRIRRSVDHWRSAKHQVREDAEHAVLWFGSIEGWDNAPFLFCRTGKGWKFDVVHQRLLVVMGESPRWMIEQGDYPYVELLPEAPQSTRKDLPLPAADRYSCLDDVELARQIGELEKARERSPDDIGVLTALARLNVITARRPTHVKPLLERLKKLAPNQADVYKYAAIYDVQSFFQYETALTEMRAYVKLRPEDAFGHNFIGFLHHQLGDNEASIESLERAVEISPDNVYAYSLLARDHALLASSARSDSSRRRHREQAFAMLRRAEASPTPSPARVERLRKWLDGKLP
jgi:tetratricopeptide (TPR) repeat protein